MTITAMGNTFSCLNVHGVISTKERVPTPEVRERLWPDLGGIGNSHRPPCPPADDPARIVRLLRIPNPKLVLQPCLLA